MRFALRFNLYFCLLTLFPFGALASPTETVNTVLTEIKGAKSFKPLLDYVHWESAYKKLSPNSLVALSVKSAKELEQFTREGISNPENVVKQKLQMLRRGLAGKENEKALALQMNPQTEEFMLQALKQKITAEEAALAEAKWELGSESISNDRAIVPVTIISQSKPPKTHQVELIKINSRWLLTGVAFKGVDF